MTVVPFTYTLREPWPLRVSEPPPRPSDARPQVIVLAGPNGAGKTTVATELLRDMFGVPVFVNADEIARGLSVFAPERQAVAAGRMMLDRLRELAEKRSEFAFETTLSGRHTWRLVERCREAGYAVHLVFVWPRSVELTLERVRSRVASGGHGVPEADVRRRYDRGLAAFMTHRREVASWHVFDSSGSRPQIVARGHWAHEEVLLPDAWTALTRQAQAAASRSLGDDHDA